jgi:hypothetical protein
MTHFNKRTAPRCGCGPINIGFSQWHTLKKCKSRSESRNTPLTFANLNFTPSFLSFSIQILLQHLPPRLWAYTSSTILLILKCLPVKNISQRIRTDFSVLIHSMDASRLAGRVARQDRSFRPGLPVRASFLGSNTIPNKQEGMPSKTYAQE